MLKYYTAALFLLLLTSCTTSYIANSVHTPLLNNKGEVQAGLNLRGEAFYFVPTLEAEAAWAITNHIGMMYSGSYAFKNALDSDNGSTYSRRNFTEFGTGYFNKISDDFHYELYGGYGQGSIDERYEDDDGDAIVSNRVKYNRFFVQPTVAYVKKSLNLALTTRVITVDYIENSESDTGFTAIEPVFSIQAGNKLIVQAQFGYSFQLKHFEGDYNPSIASVGVKYRFGRKQLTKVL